MRVFVRACKLFLLLESEILRCSVHIRGGALCGYLVDILACVRVCGTGSLVLVEAGISVVACM